MAEHVSIYDKSGGNDKGILKQIKQDRRSVELMSNLPNFDTDTLCHIIENKLTPKDCEKILSNNKDKILGKILLEGVNDSNSLEMDDEDDDLIISPAKNLYSRNPYSNNDYSLSGDENGNLNEKEAEKKKKKNKKKKKKRKEKKLIA